MRDRLRKLKDLGRKPGAEEHVRKNFLSYFKKNESHLSFGEKIGKLYEWLTAGSLARRDKLVVIGALFYFINPLDMIPDTLPFVGFTDDMAIIYLAYNYLQNRAIEEDETGSEEAGSNGKPPQDPKS